VNPQELRPIVIEVARHTGMLINISQNIVDAFLAGTSDIRLTALNTESLALMEFCIVLEENHDISLAPRDFFKHETLGAMVERLGSNESH
jgi:hypothetical protein